MGGISASRRVGDWWAAQVGPGKALDTRYYCVLGFDYLSALPAGRSEEHTSELQSLMRISYAVFCLKKKKTIKKHNNNHHNTTTITTLTSYHTVTRHYTAN